MKKGERRRKFPKTVYLRWEGDEDEPYLVGQASLRDTVDEPGIDVGFYQLVMDVETKTSLSYRPKGTKTWEEGD